MNFLQKLTTSISNQKSHVCVGLDSRYDRIPEAMKKDLSLGQAIFAFNKQVIEVTHDLAACYKMNVAFYAGFGPEGLEGLRLTNEFLKTTYPAFPRIADCKRSEMGESVKMVKSELFDWLLFDCVMVTPWFGFDTVKDYLDNDEHGVSVYVHDSNPTAIEFQDLELKDGRRVYEVVAQHIKDEWSTKGNVFVEAGATYPEQLKKIRNIVGPEMPILVAGVGAQGGGIEVLQGLFGTNGERLLVNSSRGIIFAGEGKSDYFVAVRDAAKKLRDELRIASKT